MDIIAGSETGAGLQTASWPPPAARHYRRFASADLDEVRAYANAVFNPLHLMTPPGLTGIPFSHAQAVLDRMSFNFLDYGHADGYVDVSIPDTEGCFYLQFSLTGTCELPGSGGSAHMTPGSAIVFQPGLPCRLRLRPGYKALFLRGDQAALERALARELGRPLDRPLRFAEQPTEAGGATAALVAMVSLVCRGLNGEHAGIATPALGRQVEETILLLMVRSLLHNYTAELRRASAGWCPAYVRRAEAYIEAHAREPITLHDIVRHAGTSVRTLHAAFRRYRDTTPMAFLKVCRLDLTRRDLQSAPEDRTSVTDVALNCGFSHLSRFSAEYRQRFGELPSATRRNAAQDCRRAGRARSR